MLSKPLIHQTQPTPMSCVCTCLAMLMGEPAKDVISRYHELYFDKQILDVCDILSHEGFIYERQYAGTVQRLVPGAIYLLTVASLNIQGGLHQILVDYRDETAPVVLDPAKGFGPRNYYTLDTNEVDDVINAKHLISWIIDFTITDRG